MIKCQICQHENPEGAEYCEDCGAALSTPEPASATASTPPVSPEVGVAPAPAAPREDYSPSAPTVNLTPPAATAEAQADVAAAQPPAPPPVPSPAADTAPSAPPAGPAPAVGQPRLVGRRYGADSGEVYPLLGERLVVGRFDPDSGPVDIDLSAAAEAANVSRHHAEVYREADGRWYVKDLGAVNGVFVKGAGSSAFGPRLTAPQALQNGDEVAFGNARFVFRTD